MRSFLHWPIRRHLLLLVFLAILPALGIIVYTGLETRRQTLERAERDMTYLLFELAAVQENLSDDARRLFETLSELPAIRRRDAAACNTLLASLLRRRPQHAALMAIDPEGNGFASDSPFRPTNVADRKYFREAVATRTFSAGEYAVGRVTKKSSLHFAYPVFDRKGELLAVVATAFDVRHFEAAFARERMPEGSMLLITDHAGIVLHDSRDPARTGRVAGEGEVLAYIHPDDRDTVAERYLKRLRGENVPSWYVLRVLAKTGETLSMENVAVLITWEGRPATLNFLRDISTEKKLEAQLLHAQKLEALGTLAGGVAHDFNNLLQAISGFASLTLMDLPEGDRRRPHVQNIEKAAARATELVRRLLTFTRRDRTRHRPLDLNRQVASAVELLERTIPKMIRIETRLAPDLLPVQGDAMQIEQLVMNLGTNARDAMPEGGHIILGTENRPGAPGDPAGTAPGPCVVLRVTDTGTGMDAATIAKMYDPFFTTKEVGAGTGLGLSTVHGIVRSHGGRIRCTSEPGRGACFEIVLPAFEGPLASLDEEDALQAEPLRGSGTILLVDDEEMVRDLGQKVLESDGYSVRTAGSGEAALDLYRTAEGGFDLVILDLGMPGMGGRKCLEALKKLSPAPKVLIVSGYSEDQHAMGIIEAGANAFLGKPYSPHALARTVKRILDGA